ncbi:hypothetical protein ABT273_39900, partial [Streptomyces humidus]|uniref:hypothetical protein n=1 Tax=Streptomyces humidus TaxID=52259 RepID=UPI0033284711
SEIAYAAMRQDAPRLRGGMVPGGSRRQGRGRPQQQVPTTSSSQQGNAVAGTSAAGSSHVGSDVPHDGRVIGDFIDAPADFLQNNVLLLRMDEGMRQRMPGSGIDSARFLHWMDGKDRHWFTMTVDPSRSKPDRPVYLLTPAVEKYVEAFAHEDAELREIVQGHDVPAVGGPETYVAAHYVPYLRGSTTNAEVNVGHADVPVRRNESFSPDFVFTAAMNGCALVLTDGAREDTFTVWHYQSPNGAINGAAAEAFRTVRRPLEWFGHEQYMSANPEGMPEVTNILWRGPEGWKVLSQENHTSPYSMSEVSLHNFRSKQLAPGREWIDVWTIHRATAHARLAKISAGRDSVSRLDGDKSNLNLLSAYDLVKIQAESDARALDDVTGPSELLSVARSLRDGRQETDELVRRLLENQDVQERQDSRNWTFRRANDVPRLRENVRRLISEFSDSGWSDSLEREARAVHDAMPGHADPTTDPAEYPLTPPPAQLHSADDPTSPEEHWPHPVGRTTFLPNPTQGVTGPPGQVETPAADRGLGEGRKPENVDTEPAGFRPLDPDEDLFDRVNGRLRDMSRGEVSREEFERIRQEMVDEG